MYVNETNYCLIQLKLDILIFPNKIYIRIFDDVCSIDIVFHWERDKKRFMACYHLLRLTTNFEVCLSH